MSGRSVSFEHLWRDAGAPGNDFVCILAARKWSRRDGELPSAILKFESETLGNFCG